MRSLDGAECPHGVNVFNPEGCPACTLAAQQAMGGGAVKYSNGHVPNDALARKIAEGVKAKMQPTETD